MESLPVPTFESHLDRILTLVSEGKVTIEILERMLSLQREMKADYAKEQFIKAMAGFQAECPVLKRRKEGSRLNNNVVAFHYTPLEHMVEDTKELRLKHGLSYSFTTENTDADGVSVACLIQHIDGHEKAYSSGHIPWIEGNRLMRFSQVVEGTITVACRKAFAMGFGIVTEDEDRAGTVVDITAMVERLKELMEKLPNGKRLVDAVLAKRGVQELSDLPPVVLASITKQLQERLEAHE